MRSLLVLFLFFAGCLAGCDWFLSDYCARLEAGPFGDDVVFTADGERLFVPEQGQVRLWNFRAGSVERRLQTAGNAIVEPESQDVLLVESEENLVIARCSWSTPTEEGCDAIRRFRFDGYDFSHHFLAAMRLSADGGRLAIPACRAAPADPWQGVLVADAVSGEAQCTFQGALDVAFVPGGSLLVVLSGEEGFEPPWGTQRLELYDLSTCALSRSLLAGELSDGRYIWDMQVSPDGALVALGAVFGRMILELAPGGGLVLDSPADRESVFAWHPGGLGLARGPGYGEVPFMRAPDWSEEVLVRVGYSYGGAFSPDGRYFASEGSDPASSNGEAILVWELDEEFRVGR